MRKVSKDIALSVQHPGQIVPDLEEIKTIGLDKVTQSWLKSADKLFYTWHCCESVIAVLFVLVYALGMEMFTCPWQKNPVYDFCWP